MLDVGCPEPALVDERIESTRSCAASSATVSRLVVASGVIVVMGAPSGGNCSVRPRGSRSWTCRHHTDAPAPGPDHDADRRQPEGSFSDMAKYATVPASAE